MTFNSVEFMVFFPFVVLLYYMLPQKAKSFWLLIASYYFYMCWNAEYALLILFSTAVTYLSGLLMERIKRSQWEGIKKRKAKKGIVALSFLLNLSILFYFKYGNFVMDMLSRAFRLIHVDLNVPTFDVILPIGISFYTFQALSYTMDVYREEIYAEKNFWRYALFVSFFPQLVAGPIERSKNLLKQLAVPKIFDFESAKDGIFLMIWGFFLKMVIADRAARFIDTAYGNFSIYAGWYLIVATIFFAIQIYCDFYGYSVIAMGAAKILGIQLMENFDAPYLSASVAGFWRKWHISLTSWFKDYLYIPLGGNKKGQVRKYVNEMIVFIVSGIWHGASLSFVVWGGINGLFQVVREALQPIRNKLVRMLHLNRESLGHKFVRMVGTFLLVDFSWIFFRARGLKEAFEIIRQMITVNNIGILFDGSIYDCGLDSKNFCLLLICIVMLLIADFCKYKKIQVRYIIAKQDYWFQIVTIAFFIVAILIFGIYGKAYDETKFIYFQF